MLICHRYRFIFLKTQKTAGTAIEIGLRAVMHASAVITPISTDDERINRQTGDDPRQLRNAQINQPLFNASGRFGDQLSPAEIALVHRRCARLARRLGYALA